MARGIAVVIAIVLLALSGNAMAQAVGTCSSNARQIQQLRIYELTRANKDAFHARFRDHALRIMDRHGFNIIDIWESDSGDKVEFVYLLAWPDQATLDARWKDFLADKEWIAIKKQTNDSGLTLVESVNSRVLSRLSYSPACDDPPISAAVR